MFTLRLNRNSTIMVAILVAVVGGLLIATACSGEEPPPEQIESTGLAGERENFVPVNDVPAVQWNKLQKMRDDPSVIIWCTAFPKTVGQEVFTSPLVGGLNSSQLTPFPTKFVVDPAAFGKDPKPAELADPTGMYGVRADFLYGFDPTGEIIHMYMNGMETYCTNAPLVWQANETRIVVKQDPRLVDISNRAQEALEAGDTDRAFDILQEAESSPASSE